MVIYYYCQAIGVSKDDPVFCLSGSVLQFKLPDVLLSKKLNTIKLRTKRGKVNSILNRIKAMMRRKLYVGVVASCGGVRLPRWEKGARCMSVSAKLPFQ